MTTPTLNAINYIDPADFRTEGFLQEANRLFFHPRGLALEVTCTDWDDPEAEVKIGGVWDYRDDPEGMLFGDNVLAQDKADHVEAQRLRHAPVREALFGPSGIQPIGSDDSDE